MKKILLAAAVTAAFSSSAFANNDFYVRGDVAYNKFNNNKIDGVKLKGKYNPSMEIGVGYGVMDNLRAEIVYGYQFNPTKKYNTVDQDAGITYSGKLKAQIQTVMVKGYFDAADLGMAKIFVGAGVGMSRIKSKINSSVTEITTGDTETESFKEKAKNNFTYSLALGSSFDVTDAVKVDLQYNFQDFGKSSGKFKDGTSMPKVSYRSHAIKLGARFAI